MSRVLKPWTPPEETRLLLAAALHRGGVCKWFAGRTGRTERSVRIKLCRLEKDPINRAPAMATPTDAAAPRVQPARGPGSTPDRQA